MTRTTRDENISTRAARDRLKPSGKPYFRHLDEGLHIGYRKGARSAAWVVRWYSGDKNYRMESLDGRPDDVLEADGVTVLNWTQAQAEARKLFQRMQRQAAGLDTEPEKAGPYTVRRAIADYLVHLGRHGKTVKDTTCRADALILPQLGDIDAAKLSAARMRTWLDEVAAAPPRLRLSTKDIKEGKIKVRAIDPNDPEATRRRRSTANRTLTILTGCGKTCLYAPFPLGSKPSERVGEGLQAAFAAIFPGFHRFEADSGHGQATAISLGSLTRL